MSKAQDVKQDAVAQDITPAQRIRADWKGLLEKVSYRGIVNNIPFMAFVALLCVVYITSNQNAIETQRELEKQQQVLKELRWKYMDVKARLMASGTEAEVIRNAEAIGLKPLMLPAYRVPVEKPVAPKEEND